MRALAAFLGVLAPLATISAAVFGIVWKIKHPGRPIAEAPSALGRAVKVALLVTFVAVVLLAMVLLGVGMVRAMLDPTLT